MNKEYTIKTHRGAKKCSRQKAILHASKAHRKEDCGKGVIAPRGQKTSLIAAARQVYDLRESPGPDTSSVHARLRRKLVSICADQIDERHLTTPAGWYTFPQRVLDRDINARLWLIGGSGWYEYSKRAGSHHQAAAYLCGIDAGQHFAVRVPSTVNSVFAALRFLEPADIRKARESGIQTKRQGDIYFRPVRGLLDHDTADLSGSSHTPRPRKDGGLTIVHPQHKPVILSGKYKWRAYRSTQIHSAGRAYAD